MKKKFAFASFVPSKFKSISSIKKSKFIKRLQRNNINFTDY